MATYVLIHGAGDVGWYWHLVEDDLRERGHDTVAPDLPCDDDSAGLPQYADTVVDAIGDRTDLVVVAQSAGAFTAPLVCERVPAELLVLVAGLFPSPGETSGGLVGQHRLRARARRVVGRRGRDLLPRCSRRPGCRGAEARTRPVGHAEPRAVAASTPGPTCRRDSCCAVATACSRPTSSDESYESASGSPPTRSTQDTASPSADRWSSRSVSMATTKKCRVVLTSNYQ